MCSAYNDLEKMFYPESVAVVGASDNPSNMGRAIVQNLIEWDFGGKVYPVNPRGEDVMGLKGYASIADVPRPVDLAVAMVPAKVVPSVMDQCAEAGIKMMAIPSGGFSELGEEGARLSDTISEKATEHHIRFVGPNGLTITNADNGLCLSFLPMKKRERGHISFISQSGGVGLTLIMFLDNAGSCFNKFVSVGNKVNMDELDFLEYLADDPGTEVICMFLESLVRGDRFLEIASKLTKPLLVYKANTTEVGHRTAASHTAALANNDAVVEGVFQQAGVFRVDRIQQLMHLALSFALPPMRGNRLAVVSPAGGYAVLTADEASKRGFEFPEFDPDTLDGLKDYVRSGVIKLGNPLDLGDIHSSDAIVYALDRIMAQENVDGVVTILLRRADATYDGAYAKLSRPPYKDIGKIIERHQKPLALCLLTQCQYLYDVRTRMNFPIFESPEDAVAALAALRDFHFKRGGTAKLNVGCCK